MKILFLSLFFLHSTLFLFQKNEKFQENNAKTKNSYNKNMKKYKEIFTPEARQRILDFTISSVEKFLENHPDEKFYGFAFSTHVYYGELTLAFNSERGFQNTKECYLEKYNSHFTNRFSIGDWEYNLDGFLYTLEKEIEEESDRLYELHDGTLDIFLEEYLIGEYH